MTASEMEFPHKLRPNYYNIGPMVFNNRKELRTVQIKTDKIESVIQKCKLENKALIYCSLSTLSDSDQSFAEKIIQAISNNFDWVLIMSTGKKMTIEKKSGFGENIFIFDFVPQLEVLQSADCSINHGGIHTINECIEYKVPMLIYSGKKSDQNGCAARVEYHKLGIVADKDIDSVIDVKNNIKSILANRSYKDKVIEMNKSCRKYKEKSFVSQIINPLLREKKMIIA
jgi:UDP:flavonoid glycosyltransferase YjiC (YdhE family)